MIINLMLLEEPVTISLKRNHFIAVSLWYRLVRMGSKMGSELRERLERGREGIKYILNDTWSIYPPFKVRTMPISFRSAMVRRSPKRNPEGFFASRALIIKC